MSCVVWVWGGVGAAGCATRGGAGGGLIMRFFCLRWSFCHWSTGGDGGGGNSAAARRDAASACVDAGRGEEGHDSNDRARLLAPWRSGDGGELHFLGGFPANGLRKTTRWLWAARMASSSDTELMARAFQCWIFASSIASGTPSCLSHICMHCISMSISGCSSPGFRCSAKSARRWMAAATGSSWASAKRRAISSQTRCFCSSNQASQYTARWTGRLGSGVHSCSRAAWMAPCRVPPWPATQRRRFSACMASSWALFLSQKLQ
mmetsp:Transcript_4112/g.12107  ORF Transcript_4112/g.12107 Transcript_4112/m.12107 type:complete len:263 (-) Transcript_4112:1723-2511(-)